MEKTRRSATHSSEPLAKLLHGEKLSNKNVKTSGPGNTEKGSTSRTHNSKMFTNQALADKSTLLAKESKNNLDYSGSRSSSSKSNKDAGSQKGVKYSSCIISASKTCRL